MKKKNYANTKPQWAGWEPKVEDPHKMVSDFSEKHSQENRLHTAFKFLKTRLGKENAVDIHQIAEAVYGEGGTTKAEAFYRKSMVRTLVKKCQKLGLPICSIRVKVVRENALLKWKWVYFIPRTEAEAHLARATHIRMIKGNIKWMVWKDVQSPIEEEKKKEILRKAKVVDMATDDLIVYTEKAQPIVIEEHARPLLERKKKKKKILVSN